MCEPFSIAMGVGAALAVAGSATSYVASQNAASDAAHAQSASMWSQNAAFGQRMQAQQEQISEQSRAADQANARFTQAQQQQQASQTDALNQRKGILDQQNQQELAVGQQHDQAVQTALDATTPQALQQAQASQYQAQSAMNAPNVAEAGATNPLGASGASGASSSVSGDAMARGQAGAAKFVQQYGDSLARLNSYAAPSVTAGQAAGNLGTNLMPAAVAQNLLTTSTPALLDPSTTAYRNAGAYGAAENTANQTIQQGQLGIINERAQNTIDLANLGQEDAAAIIQGNLNIQQANAAKTAALGQGISSLGNVALSYGASQGGLSKLFGSATPTAAQLNAAPYIVNPALGQGWTTKIG